MYKHPEETPRPVLNNTVLIVLLFCFVIPGLIYLIYINSEQERWDNETLIKSVTFLNRGESSERHLILNLLKAGIPAQTIFHDLFVQKSNGHFTQIDLAIATKVGIIVIEVKDFSGWIFGNGTQTNWTQVLAYGRDKHRFYNPVIQNNNHIKYLQKALWQEKVPFYSVIVFYGNCELREINDIPKGTFIVYPNQVISAVNSIINNNPPANYTNKRNVVEVLKTAMENGNNFDNYNAHIKSVHEVKERRYTKRS